MAFEDINLSELRAISERLIGEIISLNAELRDEASQPIEQEVTFNLSPRKTPKGKKLPPHKYTVRLKGPEDFERAWDEAVNSFKRRFDKRKQWSTADGRDITPREHRRRESEGIKDDKLSLVKRWNERAWNSIMVGLEPSESDRNTIKQLTFADLDRINELKAGTRQRRNELNRIDSEIDRREWAIEHISKRWRDEVLADTTEDELRGMPQRQLYAKFGLKTADIDYARRFKKGEIGIEDVFGRVKSYYKLD